MSRTLKRCRRRSGRSRLSYTEFQRADGGCRLSLNIKDSQRHSAARAFLIPVLRRPNLTALPYAHARRLLFEGKRCVGVEYAHEGEVKEARANAEVIVSAGTIESPKLLLLSGSER
jgi:choline dehydrogenase